MPLNTVDSSGTQMVAATHDYWSGRLIRELHPFLRTLNFAQMEVDVPMNQGQQALFHTMPAFAATTTALDESSDPSGTTVVLNEMTATPLEYGDFAEVSARLLQTIPMQIMPQIIRLQSRQVALVFDTVAQTALLAGSQVSYAGTAVSRITVATGDLPDTDDLDAIILKHNNASVIHFTPFLQPNPGQLTTPGEPAYVALVNPDAWEIFRALTNVFTVDQYQAGNVIFPGEVGKYRQIRFVMNTTGYVFAGAGAAAIDVHAILVFGQGAFGTSSIQGRGLKVLQKDLDRPEVDDRLGRKAWSAWKADFAAIILLDENVERFEFSIA